MVDRRMSANHRAEVTQPVAVHAGSDGVACLKAVDYETAASVRLTTVGRFGRRKTCAEHRVVTEQTQTRQVQVRESCGEPPRTSRQCEPNTQQRGSE